MLENSTTRASYVAIGVIVVLCLIVGSWWLDQHNGQYRSTLRNRHWAYDVQPMTVQDWMTFNYLDSVFSLPPTYLQSALGIQDAQYPNISIRQYATEHGIDVQHFLGQVRSALASRSATSTP